MKIQTITFFASCNIFLSLAISQAAKSQVIPDGSLPENSTVIPEGDVIQIEGGTTRGNNLFHSFEQFSVPQDTTASFNNAVEINNIFSRVTGNSISNIEGIIATQGTADLFLINSNGIIFGENAALNVGGSFLATTAENIRFADDTQFSTNATDAPPLLTVTAPVGLGLGTNPQDIINRSFAFDTFIEDYVGLQVLPENTIALIGGNISIEGGIITANEGRIELGAVRGNERVDLASDRLGWKPSYENVRDFQDIEFNSSGFIFGEGEVGTDIQVQGRNIDFTEGAQAISVAFGSEAGNVVVNGSESVTIDGTDGEFSSGLFNDVEETATGAGKTIAIETKQLTLLDGGQIFARTFGDGQGVSLKINAVESVIIQDGGIVETDRVPSGLFSRVNPGATGNGGSITVETPKILVEGGGQISVSTLGKGTAGNLGLIASESIQLVGEDIDTNDPSGLFSRVNPGATGDGGNVSIQTPQLTVLDKAQISTTGSSTGNGGNLTLDVSDTILLSGTGILGREIDSSGLFVSAEPSFVDDRGNLVITTANAGTLNLTASQLIVEEGAKISADTFGRGTGANVNIDVSDLIIRNGGIIGAGSLLQPVGFTGEDFTDNIRGTGGTITVNAAKSVEITGTGNIGDTQVDSSLFTRAEGTGNAGNLTVATPDLTVANGGNINVSATGTGEAGSLNIVSQNITLNDGSLTAETRRGSQGNISLSDTDALLFRNNSQITTNAAEQATGGDINIDSDAIALLDESDITANAVAGRGGNISLTTQGIFQEPNSTITAASELGIDGTITINSPDVDPTSGVIELPTVPIDADAILAQDLCKFQDEKIAKGSSFIITGRGGLNPTSEEPLSNVDSVVGWANQDHVRVSDNGTVAVRQRSQTETESNNYPVIQQSQGWVTTADGSVWLVATSPKAILQKNQNIHPNCGSLQK